MGIRRREDYAKIILLIVGALLIQGCSIHNSSSGAYKNEILQWMKEHQAEHLMILTNWKEDIYKKQDSYVSLFYNKILFSSSPQFNTGDVLVSWNGIDEKIDIYVSRELTRSPNENKLWVIAFRELNIVEMKVESIKLNQTDSVQRAYHYVSDLPVPVMFQVFRPGQPELAVFFQAVFDIHKTTGDK